MPLLCNRQAQRESGQRENSPPPSHGDSNSIPPPSLLFPVPPTELKKICRECAFHSPLKYGSNINKFFPWHLDKSQGWIQNPCCLLGLQWVKKKKHSTFKKKNSDISVMLSQGSHAKYWAVRLCLALHSTAGTARVARKGRWHCGWSRETEAGRQESVLMSSQRQEGVTESSTHHGKPSYFAKLHLSLKQLVCQWVPLKLSSAVCSSFASGHRGSVCFP